MDGENLVGHITMVNMPRFIELLTHLNQIMAGEADKGTVNHLAGEIAACTVRSLITLVMLEGLSPLHVKPSICLIMIMDRIRHRPDLLGQFCCSG